MKSIKSTISEGGFFSPKKTRLLLLFIFVMGSLVKLGLILNKDLLTHDESISYLACSANQGEYKNIVSAAGDEFNAGFIKEVYHSKPKPQFKKIAHDLAHNDFHPPLYFFLVQLIQLCFDFSIFNGQLLNVFFGFISALVFYGFLRKWQFKNSTSFLILCIWFLSPCVFMAGFEARPYALFELLSLCCLFCFSPGSNSTIKINYAGLLIATICGFLTHYYFGLLPFSLFLALLIKGQFRSAIALSLTVIVAIATVFIFHPEYHVPIIKAFSADKTSTQAIAAPSLFVKSKVFYHNLLSFLSEWAILKYALMLAVPFLIIFEFFKSKWTIKKDFFFVAFVMLFLITTFLYLFGITQSQAVSYEYFSYLWPLLSIQFGLLIQRKVLYRGLVSVIVIFSLVHSVQQPRYLLELPSDLETAIEHCAVLEVSSAKRGFLPRVAILLNDETKIIIQNQKEGMYTVKVNGPEFKNRVLEREYIRFIY